MSSRALVLRPSAKINLTLRVGDRRRDGFHGVTTLLQSIGLADRMTVTARPGPFALQVRSPGVPDDRTNLVWRAAELLWRDLGRSGDARDVHVRLEKQIPAAAGLGGGSADAAAALAALNVVWNGRRSRRALMQLAAALGSDVPFFFVGGTAVGVGRGEEIYPVDDVARLGVIVVKPSFGVGTADAYAWLDESRAASAPTDPNLGPSARSPGPEGLGNPGASRRSPGPSGPGALDVGWPSIGVTVINDLQAPVAARHPMIQAMVEACLQAGALAAAMSGSGSAVFGLFPETQARRAAARLQRPDWLVALTRTLTRREACARLGL